MWPSRDEGVTATIFREIPRYHFSTMMKNPRMEMLNNFVLIILLLAIGLAPLVEIANNIAAPLLQASERARLLEILVDALCAVCVVLTLQQAWQTTFKQAWTFAPSPFVLLLFLWSSFCLYRSPYPDFALAEWLRIVFCLEIFIVAAYGLDQRNVRKIIRGLIVLGTGMAMYGLLQFGAARSSGGTDVFDRVIGLFGDSENLGSFLMILMPLAVWQAFDRNNAELLRLSVQAATLIMLITLAVNCTRSAWIDGTVALTVMGLLTVRNRPAKHIFPRQYWLISAAAGATILAALVIASSNTMVFNRAFSLSHTTQLESFKDRRLKSKAAFHMAEARPWAGWGLGTWPVVQRHWTGEGDTPTQVFARHDLWSRGGDQQSLAHNFYMQWAAETGGIGLCLYAATLGAFFFLSLRLLPKIRSPRTRGLLVSCVAAATGACLDAATSPAYNFPGVSGLLWLCLGLGTATGREAET